MKKLLSKLKWITVIIAGLFILVLSACGLIPKTHVHGEKLLRLSDDQLYEAVYFYTLDLVESYPSDEAALAKLTPARRTFFVLSIFDMELQNGGLCQFFVNTSSPFALCVDECLVTVGAEAHRQMFLDFLSSNGIDLRNLESFQISTVEEYQAQLERFDYETFEDAFFQLPALREILIAYVKANISEF